MKYLVKLFLILLFITSGSFLFAQDVTGIWRGYFITDGGENYTIEFQVKQAKTSTVTGVSYSYLDKRFYGKASMTGYFIKPTKSFTIQETKTTEVKNLGGGGTCLMNYKFSYVKSGNEEFLEGTFNAKSEDRLDPKNNGQWGDCSGGKVYLRRVETSDFYVEPFLRDNPVVKKTTPPQSKPPIAKTTQKPPATTITKTPSTTKKNIPPVQNKTAKKVITKPKNVTLKQIDKAVVKSEPKKINTPKIIIPIPASTRSRQNELTQTITVQNDEVTVRLYDNGEIDDDTISVYLDNQLVLSSKRLSTVPLTVSLKIDETNPEHTLVMVAENLGKIPPNTSLMIVHDGDKRYEVRITSTEQKNAMVRFRYSKANSD